MKNIDFRSRFSNDDDLIEKLKYKIENGKKLLLLIGSGVTLPEKGTSFGIPGTKKLIRKLKEQLGQLNASYLEELEVVINKNDLDTTTTYQYLAHQIESRYETAIVDRVIRESVLTARKDERARIAADPQSLERDVGGWHLNRGIDAIGKILVQYQQSFADSILTSNFDPLIEISLKSSGRDSEPIFFDGDFSISTATASASYRIVHYHGFWRNSRTINTAVSMATEKPHLEGSIEAVIRAVDAVLVIGFGGWIDDVFIRCLSKLIKKGQLETEIMWAFHEDSDQNIEDRDKSLLRIFGGEIANKIFLYKGIDSNKLFPSLLLLLNQERLRIWLDKYSLIKQDQFNKKWPYELRSNDHFVEGIPYLTGKLTKRDYTQEGIDCVSHIDSKLTGKIVICCAYYGMGKTIVASKVFEKIREKQQQFPVFFDLSRKDLSRFVDYSVEIQILSELEDVLPENDFSDWLAINGNIEEIVEEFLREKEVILIFDAIDEAICSMDVLRGFAEKLVALSIPLLISTRIEFYQFFDDLYDLFETHQCTAVELAPWGEDQWEIYLERLRKYYEGTEIPAERIDQFKLNLLSAQYGQLPQRPLFLKMLTDLNVLNEEFELKLHKKLMDNKAEVYYKFIMWNLKKEMEKGAKLWSTEEDKEECLEVVFELLSRIAVEKYIGLHNKPAYSNDLADLKDEIQPSQLDDAISFRIKDLKTMSSGIGSISENVIETLFELDSALPIIRRIPNSNKYVFSHKSFLEYLVANHAVASIFLANSIEKAKCSRAWNVYQTDEVSDYFSLEVERITITKEIPEEEQKRYFESAFLKEMENLPVSKDDYSERLEEVLYYAGKYRIATQETLEFLKKLFNNRGRFHPIYFRTSAISLSRLESLEIMVIYLSKLISDYKNHPNLFFGCQIEKDVSYYGQQTLYEKTNEAYQQLLSRKKMTPLILLKVYSYFVSREPESKGELKQRLHDLFQLKSAIEGDADIIIDEKESTLKAILGLLEGIEFILEDRFRERFYFPEFDGDLADETKLNELLETAFNRRITLREKQNTNIYRLINSTGDRMPGVFTDVYGDCVVVQFERPKAANLRDSIVHWLKEKLGRHVGVYEKSTNWKSRRSGLFIETAITGPKQENISCYEGDIKIIVSPKMSKSGFFIDNRPVRNYLRECSQNATVLNCFAFTCVYGVICLKYGAERVINIDKDEEVLDLGKKIYEINDLLVQQEHFIQMDCFEYLAEALENKERYDIVILDPPEFIVLPENLENVQRTFFKLNNLAVRLLNKNGILVTSSCDHGFSKLRFKNVIEGILSDGDIGLKRISQPHFLPLDHPIDGRDKSLEYLKTHIIQRTS